MVAVNNTRKCPSKNGNAWIAWRRRKAFFRAFQTWILLHGTLFWNFGKTQSEPQNVVVSFPARDLILSAVSVHPDIVGDWKTVIRKNSVRMCDKRHFLLIQFCKRGIEVCAKPHWSPLPSTNRRRPTWVILIPAYHTQKFVNSRLIVVASCVLD